MEDTVQQEDIWRLGQIIAVFYEEGLLEQLGLKPEQVVIDLFTRQSQVVLEPILQLRDQLPECERLATIRTPPPIVLSDADIKRLYAAYQSQLVHLIYNRWFGLYQYVREVI